jgi:hypothetical protein
LEGETMTRSMWALLTVALVGATAGAQPPLGPRPLTGVNTPPVSPYLNLLRPGTSPAINYYGLVRPELNVLSSMQALQAQLGYVQQANGLLSGEGATTGHPAYFLNHGTYFLNLAGQPSAAGGPRAPARPAFGSGMSASTTGASRPIGR